MKNNTVFVCQECGYESPKWMGQCICGAWNSFIEEKIISVDDSRSRNFSKGEQAKPVQLAKVDSNQKDRLNTGIGELNRVLGGGIVKGSLTLIAGEPGIGKSTLILQTAIKIAENYGRVLYVSGEESEEQIKMRADRISAKMPPELYLLSETNIENISDATVDIAPVFLIIDSIQTMYTNTLESAAGSVSQVRSSANELMKTGKVRDIPVFIVAHVTKSGELAGPKIIEHLVDCVLQFAGERNQDLRILRANKNRFGTSSEIGAFEMSSAGLVEVENLSKSLLEDVDKNSEGSVFTAVYEGTRPLILEIQALTAPVSAGFARRSSVGIDLSRLNMIIAVLERKAGLSLADQDVYVNVVGGIRPEGTCFDLAVALAIYSSIRGATQKKNTLIIGEIGLTGDLRSVKYVDKIAKEAERLDFDRLMIPKKNADKLGSSLEVVSVSDLKEAISKFK